MRFVRVIHRLLFVTALLGIVFGPLGVAVADSAMASGLAMSNNMSSTMPGMQMADDMPCCPEKQPVKPDCGKNCPLAIVCTTSILADAPDNHGWSFAISWQTHRYDILPTSQLMSALVEPPARPPKA
jgi:hypothetical protein